MPQFSNDSMNKLLTCDSRLQHIFGIVIAEFDCKILCGYRGEKEQTDAYNARPQRSKLRWPLSSHNLNPSKAVDVVPYPVNWDNIHRFVLFGGYVLGIANMLGYKLRWGGDWNGDFDIRDGWDFPHFELID